MINCKLNRDIALGSGQEGSGCYFNTMNVGIADGLYVFNLEDVRNLVFENDSRPDDNLFVDTIVTSQPYYRIDASNISYQEEYDNNIYTHTISASIKSVMNDIEEILDGAVHGRYLVAFRVVGDEHYRLVGWNEGLSLDEELSISSDNNAYTLTFEGRTTYPHMEADKSNFNLSEKVFEPVFEPLFEAGKVTCSDGWAVANYVVKVNAAGQALDEDNKLVQYSGKAQDAYKLQGVSDGGYHIIGTYTQNDYFEGKSVRIYDTTLCNISCSISVSPSSLSFNSSDGQKLVTISSNYDWELVSPPSTVSLSRTNGASGTVYVSQNGVCGNETLTFRNKKGACTASLTITNSHIFIDPVFYYPNGTTEATLKPVTCGSYSGTSSEGSVLINSDGSFTVSGISTSNSEKNVTVTLTSGSETKTVTLVIYGINTTAGAKVISEFCEIEEED